MPVAELNYSVDVRPLEKSVNPFAYGAGEIRRQFPALQGADLQAVQWFEHLAAQGGIQTTSRILVLALLAAASDYQMREALETGLKVINSNLPE